MHEIQNTSTGQLVKMISTAGQEFGIRKSSYKKKLQNEEISEEQYKQVCATMDGIYFMLKELYQHASANKNLQVW